MDIDPAPTGTYQIVVCAENVPSGPQPYALVIRTDSPTPGARCATPATVTIATDPGSTGTVTMTVSNEGGSTLSLAVQQPGYAWRTSDDPDGPAYAWEDNSGGTTIPLPSDPDEGVAGPFPLGFDFSLFGMTSAQFWVSMNGAVLFQTNALLWLNTALPAYRPAGGIVAPFWTDLDCTGRTLKYSSDGTKCVISYFNVPLWGSTDLNTFQTILYNTGEIVFQYQTMNGLLTSCTVGIQGTNQPRNSVQAAYQQAFVKDAFAVEFVPSPPWLTYTPTNTTAAAYGSASITLNADASLLAEGMYTTEVSVLHSGYGRQKTVPVILYVTPEPGTALLLLCIGALALRKQRN